MIEHGTMKTSSKSPLVILRVSRETYWSILECLCFFLSNCISTHLVFLSIYFCLSIWGYSYLSTPYTLFSDAVLPTNLTLTQFLFLSISRHSSATNFSPLLFASHTSAIQMFSVFFHACFPSATFLKKTFNTTSSRQI